MASEIDVVRLFFLMERMLLEDSMELKSCDKKSKNKNVYFFESIFLKCL